MDIKTEVVQTHYVEMSQETLERIARMLDEYQRNVGDKLPDGIDAEDEFLVAQFKNAARYERTRWQ
jgi:hypothetical protein